MFGLLALAGLLIGGLAMFAVFGVVFLVLKIVFWDGTGLCLFTKRLEHGVFLWPSNVEPGGALSLTSAQLSLLIDGVDWRAPEQRWRPAVAG